MCVAMGRYLCARSYGAAFVCAQLWGGICMCVAMGQYLCARSYGAAFVCA